MEKWTRAFYQPVLPMGEDGRRVTASKEHIALSKDAAKEGMVLLKNKSGTSAGEGKQGSFVWKRNL